MGKTIKTAAVFLISVYLSGCASPVVEQARTGFISDYSSLAKESDTTYKFSSPKISAYSKFIIERPVVLFNRDGSYEGGEFTKEEIDDLVTYYFEHLVEAISEDDGYVIVDKPGEGVAKIRVALTAVDETVGALNVTIYTKITGAGLGGAAMEGEIVDSITSEQLSAVVQWGNGSRILRAGFTKLGDAKIQINKWTKNLRKRIDDAHGR
ncbi:MAG: hypothetical protein ACI9FB_002712 [Candidatus Azotimanducaceae bacterium]|jgi:hypothetical protein